MKTARRIKRFSNRLTDGVALSGDPLAEGLLDSLAIEELISYLEQEFSVAFSEDELSAENFSSIDTLAELVDRKRAE